MKKKLTVLIVDDNFENISVLGSMLGENNYNIGLAQNGSMALDSVRKKRPDLILLDIMMPGMNGFEVCRQLKQDPNLADIPIIFITARMEQENVIVGLELGAVDYVTKPFNQRELLARVNTHLELQTTKVKLQEALAAKEKALATKNKFFSIISHDLSNLFYGLSSMSALILEKGAKAASDAKKDEFSHYIMQLSEKGYILLTNLLEWSKSQTGMIQAKPVNVDLEKLVEQNIQLIHGKAKAKDINLSAKIAENAASVFVDKNMLDTVLRNLLSNAVKFTKPRGIVQISSKKLENGLVEILVSDTGVGIAAENISKLFRIDVNHSTSGTAQEKGNGLGLLLCKEFIEKNGGTIRIESQPSKGSQFYVCLPLSP